MGDEFFGGRPTREVEAQHLEGTFGWLLARPQADQQAGDDAEVDLNGNAVLAGG